jgi:ABC-type molybdate transport system substrate-binding protein
MKNFNHLLVAFAVLQLGACSTEVKTMVTQDIAPPPALVPTLAVYAAGSLRAALSQVAQDYQARTGQMVELSFGASGLMRERIEKGEPAQVFASADTEHPKRLAATGGWQQPTVFVRNSLCALTAAHINATPDTLLQTLLLPQVRLGTSTPKSDPAGDYAWALFKKAEAIQPGAYATLDAKALKLTGAAESPRPPEGRAFYAWAMDEGQADIFLTYCTNALAAQKDVPRLNVVALPAALQVGAPYGLTVLKAASPQAQAFANALLEPAAQKVFTRFGFGSP